MFRTFRWYSNLSKQWIAFNITGMVKKKVNSTNTASLYPDDKGEAWWLKVAVVKTVLDFFSCVTK